MKIWSEQRLAGRIFFLRRDAEIILSILFTAVYSRLLSNGQTTGELSAAIQAEPAKKNGEKCYFSRYFII